MREEEERALGKPSVDCLLVGKIVFHVKIVPLTGNVYLGSVNS